MECAHCHQPIVGRRRQFCTRACTDKAYRRRLAGLPEDAYPNSGRHGRVSLIERARRERLLALLTT
jgi:hypothetical protein